MSCSWGERFCSFNPSRIHNVLNRIFTGAVFLVSALSFQQSWADPFEGCSDPAFATAHPEVCKQGLGIPQQPAPWGNNGEIKKQTAETVAANKAKLKCKQMFASNPAKLKQCLANIDP
jgi:hypothetical protein